MAHHYLAEEVMGQRRLLMRGVFFEIASPPAVDEFLRKDGGDDLLAADEEGKSFDCEGDEGDLG